MRKHLYIFLFVLVFFTGCRSRYLNVQTQFISHENLASFRINTPDPELEKPVIGQSLMIEWSLPKNFQGYTNLAIKLKVRFKDHQEEDISIPVESRCGTYLFSIVQEKYIASGGISTYIVVLTGDDRILSTWKHPLWTELITF